MNKNIIYLLAALIVAAIIGITANNVMSRRTEPAVAVNPAALPSNGAMADKIPASATPQAKEMPSDPGMISNAAATSVASPAPNTADDVPAGAVVNGEPASTPAPDMPKPADDKGVAIPPSEGQ